MESTHLIQSAKIGKWRPSAAPASVPHSAIAPQSYKDVLGREVGRPDPGDHIQAHPIKAIFRHFSLTPFQ